MKQIDIRPYGGNLFFTISRNEFLSKRLPFSESSCEQEIIQNVQFSNGMSSDFKNSTLHIVGVFDKNHSTLAHELSHAVIKILESVNITINRANSEVFCYLLDDLMTQCESEMICN